MTPNRPRGFLGALAVATVLGASPAAAQAPVVVWMAGEPEAAGRAELWARRVERALERDGARVFSDEESWAFGSAGFDAGLIEEVDSIETLLSLARARASDLDEVGALALLAEAEREAEGVLAIPGGVAWVAEVEIQLAVTAFQLGQVTLARAALERAATLDPRRLLQPAEGPPELVALATEVTRAARGAPASSFRVRAIGVLPGEAQVFLDDEYVGPAPVRVETSAGLHALRVEARGRRTWASLTRALPGTRADVEVLLAASPSTELARALREDARRGDYDAIPARLAALDALGVPLEALVLVEVGEGAFDRAALVRCSPDGCAVTRRLEGEAPARRRDVDREAAADALDDARAWLDEIPDVEGPVVGPGEGDDFWEQPWPWLIAGAIVVGAGVGITAGVLTPSGPTTSNAIIGLPEDFGNP